MPKKKNIQITDGQRWQSYGTGIIYTTSSTTPTETRITPENEPGNTGIPVTHKDLKYVCRLLN